MTAMRILMITIQSEKEKSYDMIADIMTKNFKQQSKNCLLGVEN